MAANNILDLNGIAWPFCLLECNRVADQMKSGERLEVISGDPEVVEDIVKIFNRSPEHSITWNRESDHFRIMIVRH